VPTKFVYNLVVKNVTVSLDDELLRKSREFANKHGKSFNELIRDVLRGVVDNSHDAVSTAFERADRLNLRLDGPIPDREERVAR
jgi:hypothetical protein